MFQNAESRYFFLFNKVIKNLVKTWVTSKDCVIKKGQTFLCFDLGKEKIIFYTHTSCDNVKKL